MYLKFKTFIRLEFIIKLLKNLLIVCDRPSYVSQRIGKKICYEKRL